jgi:hypothetical protein
VTDGVGALGGNLVGKRYVCPQCGTELIGVKSGEGRFTCDGVAMELKTSKPLPSSD